MSETNRHEQLYKKEREKAYVTDFQLLCKDAKSKTETKKGRKKERKKEGKKERKKERKKRGDEETERETELFRRIYLECRARCS